MRDKLYKILTFKYSPFYIAYRIFCKKRIGSIFAFFYNFCSSSIKLKDCLEIIPESYKYVDQYVHPSIEYDGNNYILGLNPYPYGDCKYENPFLFFYKEDFSNPFFSQGPIFELKKGLQNYYSDIDIQFYNGEYRLIYREYIDSNGNVKTIVWCSISDNKFKWSEPKKLFEVCGKDIVCPIQFENSIYYVNVDSGKTNFYVCDRNTFETNIISIKNPFSSKILWHFDINYLSEKKVGVFTYADNSFGENSELYYGEELKNGTWIILGKINVSKYVKNLKSVYKSSFIKKDNLIFLFCSITLKNNKWKTILIKISNFEEVING